ncbi:arylsulfatase [Pseudomassariella vexata]|uniref:Arylsulfatase n=1 Tax=Pseudomassariella vexata TaxID=1141098 RepID=A0A1Y2E2I8_9PEZI|nr:arylsulfatase [Pseudomassariella vexata]ORY65763.1 arylsulfatase [Pseudomassariella vexata]
MLALGLAAVLSVLATQVAANTFPQNQVPLTGNTQHDESTTAEQPNIVFILTDDQDLQMQSMDYLPLIKKHLRDQGTFYKRHFCTTALCCPSRVSLWTGKAAHNTNVTDVNPPYGGYPKFVSQGLNENYLPIWLQDAGYNTYYTGKMFNAHTVENYNSPHVAGWTGSDFLLDPYTYSYLNSTYQRNHEAPVSHEGEYSVDVLAEKAYGFLDDAVSAGRPFFLALAPVAPHSNLNVSLVNGFAELGTAIFSAPIYAERHAHLFKDVKVPRPDNFNPDRPSGSNWVKKLPKLSEEISVDELVDGVVSRLADYGILDNTYIIYTSDNGFHIGQHRLRPGKECGFEEDINVPLIIRGPGVPQDFVTDIVTTHTDLAPTILDLVGRKVPETAHLDGEAIPLTISGISDATKTRHEHVNVEYWGFAIAEGRKFPGHENRWWNNTYKALRIVSDSWNLYYSVWCTNEHELYDLNTDPGQLINLLSHDEQSTAAPTYIQGYSLEKVAARLDSVLFVLKSCKEETCVHPWRALHPAGNVENLMDALSSRYDQFYMQQQARIEFDRCENGYIVDAEGPQFEKDGLVDRHGLSWSEWA